MLNKIFLIKILSNGTFQQIKIGSNISIQTCSFEKLNGENVIYIFLNKMSLNLKTKTKKVLLLKKR